MNQDQPTIDNLTPIGFRVLLNIYKKSGKTSWGAELPDSENSGMPVIAQIVALGDKTFWQSFLILIGAKKKWKVGQWIYFRKYSVDELQVNTPDGQMKLFVLEENEIIGIINKHEHPHQDNSTQGAGI